MSIGFFLSDCNSPLVLAMSFFSIISGSTCSVFFCLPKKMFVFWVDELVQVNACEMSLSFPILLKWAL